MIPIKMDDLDSAAPFTDEETNFLRDLKLKDLTAVILGANYLDYPRLLRASTQN